MTERRRSERRRAERRRMRMPCELAFGGRRHRAFVLDLSERGLYVQTRIAPRPHDAVRVTLRAGSGGAVELEARVARRYVVPERLASVARGGIGLELLEAPEAYRALVAEHSGAAGADDARKPDPPRARRFHVRLRESGSARSRTVEVQAGGPEAAKEAARRQLGDGWEAVAASETRAPREPASR